MFTILGQNFDRALKSFRQETGIPDKVLWNHNPADFTVQDGSLGFGATVDQLTIISIKDAKTASVLTDDVNYLGVAVKGFGGKLIGLESVAKLLPARSLTVPAVGMRSS